MADGDMRLLQGREGTGQLSITDRMDVQLSVEETYAGALLLKVWQYFARAIVTEGERYIMDPAMRRCCACAQSRGNCGCIDHARLQQHVSSCRPFGL